MFGIQVYAMHEIKCNPEHTPSGTGGQGQFLTRILAQYQAILDIATYLSLNKLLGNRASIVGSATFGHPNQLAHVLTREKIQ